MSASYTQFSSLYETFMQDAPYESWMRYLEHQFPNLSKMAIADVGCGTGTLTRMLGAAGAKVLGVDLSEDMLGIAMQESLRERLRIDWLCQDMAKLQLPRPMQLVVSSCDAINYLLDSAEVAAMFRAVWNHLTAGGVFCFDVLGEGRLATLQSGLSYDIREDAVTLFESEVSPEGSIRYDLTAFVSCQNGLYERVAEEHLQQWYSPEWIRSCLEQIGFTVHEVIGDFGRSPVSEAMRVVVRAQK